MEEIKKRFLPYLAEDGIKPQDLFELGNKLSSIKARLENLIQVQSLVETTDVQWQSGTDGQLVPVGRVTTQCMPTDTLMALHKNIKTLAMIKSVLNWINAAKSYWLVIKAEKAVDIDLDRCENIDDVRRQIDVDKYMRDVLFPLLPEPPKMGKPDEDTLINTTDYLASLGANELSRYYAAQAAAATIGDYIHPLGSFASARVDLIDKMSNPCVIEAGLKATLIKRRTPAFDIEKVDQMYFLLQSRQRDFQKQVNSVKFKAEDAVAGSEQLYYNERQRIEAENRAKTEEYNNTVNALIKKINEAANEMCIAVPAKAKAFIDEILTSTD